MAQTEQRASVTNDGQMPAQMQDPRFSQADVNDIVEKRLVRERKKYADYDQLKKENQALKNISNILDKYANICGTPEEQEQYLMRYYGMTPNEAEQAVDGSAAKMPAPQVQSLILMKAQEFEKNATNTQIVREVEKLLQTPAKKRTDEQELILEVLGARYSKILFAKNYHEARDWFEEQYPGESFENFVSDDDFLDLMQGSKLSLKKLCEKYKNIVQKQSKTSSTGSVKTTGATAQQGFFTKEEVERMSKEEISKNMETIKKSIPKWKTNY